MTIGFRIKLVLVFALLGPPIGGLLACPVLLCFGGGRLLSDAGTPDIPATLAFCGVFGPMFGYVLGFLPAASTGAILALTLPSPDRRYIVRVTALSALCSAAFGGLLLIGRSQPADETGWSLIGWAVMLAGAVAGNLCWRFLSRDGNTT